MTNRDRNSPACSSVRVGRWAISIAVPFRDARYLTVAIFPGGGCRLDRPTWSRLNDELLLDLRVDLCPDRKHVDENAHSAPG